MHVTSTSQLTCLTSFTLRRSELRGQGPDLSRPLPSFLHTSFPSRAVLFYSGASLVFLQLLLFTGCSLPSVVSLFLPVLHRCPSVKLNVMSAATCFYLSQISAFRVCLRLSGQSEEDKLHCRRNSSFKSGNEEQNSRNDDAAWDAQLLHYDQSC